MTYNQCSDSHIASTEHPECPTSHPSVTFVSSERKKLFFEEVVQDRTLIAVVDSCDGYSELNILHLLSTDINRISQKYGKYYEPNRRLPISA